MIDVFLALDGFDCAGDFFVIFEDGADSFGANFRAVNRDDLLRQILEEGRGHRPLEIYKRVDFSLGWI